MASSKTVRGLVRDIIDTATAIEERSVVADERKKGANRQANRLGTTVSGGRGDGPQHSDPTVDDMIRHTDTMERVVSTLAEVKHALYYVANEHLAEYAPNREWDDGIRRCGMDDCARPHHSRGMCDLHRKRADRARAKEAAQRAAAEGDDG